MGYQVEPERIGRRGSRATAVLVVLAALAIVGFAIATSTRRDTESRPVAVAQPTSTATPTPLPPATPPATPPIGDPITERGPASQPLTITCNDAGASLCERIVEAVSLRLAEPSSIREIVVWTSLRCRDSGDCPSSLIDGYDRLGSAVVSFGSGKSDTWVNVVAPEPDLSHHPNGGDYAWVAY
jgi:hypothetical protein